jgi:cytochrome c-type biogenesis protein CcmH
MIMFGVAAAVLAAGAAALVLWRASLAGRAIAGPDPRVVAYRRALTEVDDLAARGLLPESEHRGVRAEVGRRLISSADRQAEPVGASGKPFLPVAAIGGAVLAALAIYISIGAPGAKDQPFAGRLADWRAHPEEAPPQALAATLNALAALHPEDPTPLRKLAALDLEMGDGFGAVHALRRAEALAPRDAALPAMLGEVEVLGNNGTITPEARAQFAHAIALDPAQPAARYYLGKARIGDGDAAGGLAEWRALLAGLAANDPRRAGLAAEIAAVEQTGRLPAPQQAAASTSEMSGAIRGMVDGLAARLKAQPDDPDGWVRLVRAYAVLGDVNAREQALAEARARYANQPDEIAALTSAAATPPMGAR